ncbi:MAG: hypothetical protein AAGJ74_08880 [Pseudomonadota bacterium]
MRPTLAIAALVLTACQPTATSTLTPVGEDLVMQQERDCLAEGGRWGAGGLSGGMVCYRPTTDGGQSCSQASDCEGVCFARSRTCSPITPLFGCHDVLGALGATAKLCID